MADLSEFSIVAYERRPGHWRAALTPIRQPDDSASERDARLEAEKIISKL
jgi:hypothetical protein